MCQQLNQVKRVEILRIKSRYLRHQALKGKLIVLLIISFDFSLLLFNPNEIVDDNSMVA